MKTISEQKLKDILDKHEKWLRNEPKGVRADLSSANLSYADLRYANLIYADLSSANLRYANLSSANLRYANLTYANLSSANLRYANLRYANLSSANLSYADLSSANLSYADLSSVIGFKFTPIQIVNTKFFITIFDDHITWGCRKFTFNELKSLKLKHCTEKWDPKEFEHNKKLILDCVEFYRKLNEPQD